MANIIKINGKDVKDVKATQDIADLKSHLSHVTETTSNLFLPETIQLGKNNSGGNAPTRAISGAMYIGTGAVTVSCKSLPSNLKYQIATYESESISSAITNLTGWISDAATVTTATPAKHYMRILFGSVNNAALTSTDFEGLQLQVQTGSIKTDYMPNQSAVDYVARNALTVPAAKIQVMNFNVGHYSYGVTQAYAGDDAEEKLADWQKWFNDHPCDVACINEYYKFFDMDETISARTRLFDPVFRYAYNNLVTTVFSKYELVGQSWGYLGASDAATQRYYVKMYAVIDGVTVCIVGVHLSPAITDAVAKRAVQIADLLALVADDENVIIMGDFNVASTDEYQPFISAGYKLANGGNIGYFTTHYTGGNTSVLDPFDNIIVSPNIYINNIQCHSADYAKLTSDHYAVTCDLMVYTN